MSPQSTYERHDLHSPPRGRISESDGCWARKWVERQIRWDKAVQVGVGQRAIERDSCEFAVSDKVPSEQCAEARTDGGIIVYGIIAYRAYWFVLVLVVSGFDDGSVFWEVLGDECRWGITD